MKYFRVFTADTENSPVGVSLFGYDPELDDRIVSPGRIDNWQELKFKLVGSQPVDYLANDAAFRICSAKLGKLLHEGRGERDALQWLKVWVLDESSESAYPYFVLRFPEQPDVLDMARTETAGEGKIVLKPVLQASKVAGHHIITALRADTMLFISEQLKSALEQAGCTGMEFSPVMVSDDK